MLRKDKTRIKTSLRKGDLVQVVSGAESGVKDPKGKAASDVGKRGRIREINYLTGRIIVEGINMHKKAVRPNPQKNQQGGIITVEGSIHISNVMLVCPKDERPVRIGVKALKSGKKIRTCRICGGNIGEEY
ncbi:MAG: 50S ribosomal protein L24 [Candidatus Brocadiia bacterium]